MERFGLGELIRRIAANPGRFAVLAGAGCSRPAGVLTVREINDLISASKNIPRAELPDDELGAALAKYSPESVADQRRLLEALIEGKAPVELHRDLAALIALHQFGPIFTTNFDRLIESAARAEDPDCRVIDHERDAGLVVGGVATAGFAPTASTVVKLHGDYLADNARFQAWKTSRLPAPMREAFLQGVVPHGLLLVAYRSGDSSVIRMLEDVAADREAAPLGIYWMTRDPDPPAWLLKLDASRDGRSWIHTVVIDGAAELFHSLRELLTEESPGGWKAHRSEALKRANSEIQFLRDVGTYDASLYLPRPANDAVFLSFLADPTKNAQLFVGRSGTGKSALLAHLCETVRDLSSECIPVWYRGASWRSPGDLKSALARGLGLDAHDALDAKLRDLGRLADWINHERYVVVFIDGINEAADPPSLVAELNDLLELVSGRPGVKFVVSCRTETFRRYLINPGHYWRQPNAEGLHGHALEVEPFTVAEVGQLWARYSARAKVKPTDFRSLSRRMQKLVSSSPFLLRLVAECFGEQRIPRYITGLQVFRLYFRISVEGDEITSKRPTTAGELAVLEELIDLLADTEARRFTRHALREDLRTRVIARGYKWALPGQAGSNDSPYATLVNKGVIAEIPYDEPGDARGEYGVGFAFDRLLEFKLAHKLQEQGFSADGDRLEALVNSARDFAPLWGAARTLLLLAIERDVGAGFQDTRAREHTISFLSELAGYDRIGVQALVSDAIAELADENRKLAVGLCRGLLSSGTDSAGHTAVSAALQIEAPEVLAAGCRSEHPLIRELAAQGAVYLRQRNSRKGDALWAAIAKAAQREALRHEARSIGSGALRTITRGKTRGAANIDDLHHLPALSAFCQIGIQAYALSLGNPRERDAVKIALRRLADGPLQRRFAHRIKERGHRLFLAAFEARGHRDQLQAELARIVASQETSAALRSLLALWHGARMSDRELRDLIATAARGELLATMIIKGTLVAQLSIAPEQAIEAALWLADSDDALARWHGTTAVGYLIAACAIRNWNSADWFSALCNNYLKLADGLWSADATLTTKVGGEHKPFLDLPHLLLAGLLDGISVASQVRELVRRRPYAFRQEREALLIQGVAVLARIGFPDEALNGLRFWRTESDETILAQLSAALGELLAANAGDLEGWLDQARNDALDLLVQRQRQKIGPSRLIFDYGVYSFVTLASHPKAAARVATQVTAALGEPALDRALWHVSELFFDPKETPFYYA